MSDYARTINTTPATPMFTTPFLQSRPSGVGVGDAPGQQQQKQKLPSGFELDQIQKGQGVSTGKTQLGDDGKLWYEHRTYNGSAYWSLAR